MFRFLKFRLEFVLSPYRINSAQNIQIIPLRTSENSGWNFFKFPCECRQIPLESYIEQELKETGAELLMLRGRTGLLHGFGLGRFATCVFSHMSVPSVPVSHLWPLCFQLFKRTICGMWSLSCCLSRGSHVCRRF